MMRKRLIIAGAVLVLMAAAWPAESRTPGGPADVGPLGEEMCCREGIPQIPPGQECLVLHQIGPGENLHILGAYYYGDARAWRRIYELNKKALPNPNKLYAGQIIKIKVPPCWTPRYDLFEFMEIERKRLEVLKKAKEKEQIKEHREVQVLEAPTIVITPAAEEGVPPAEVTPTPAPGPAPAPPPPTETPAAPPER